MDTIAPPPRARLHTWLAAAAALGPPLREKPAGGVGLAVPAMPLDVLLVRRDGSASVYPPSR